VVFLFFFDFLVFELVSPAVHVEPLLAPFSLASFGLENVLGDLFPFSNPPPAWQLPVTVASFPRVSFLLLPAIPEYGMYFHVFHERSAVRC